VLSAVDETRFSDGGISLSKFSGRRLHLEVDVLEVAGSRVSKFSNSVDDLASLHLGSVTDLDVTST
jgi:hypothetical protein